MKLIKYNHIKIELLQIDSFPLTFCILFYVSGQHLYKKYHFMKV